MTDEQELWEEKAVDILEGFLARMQDDSRFTTPMEKYLEDNQGDNFVDEDWVYVYTDRGQRLATRMIDRLNKLAEKRWGFDIAFQMDIKSSLYQEA